MAEFLFFPPHRVDAFLRTDQYRAASKLISAYTEGDVEEIKRVSQSSAISHLDHVVNVLFHSAFTFQLTWKVDCESCLLITTRSSCTSHGTKFHFEKEEIVE